MADMVVMYSHPREQRKSACEYKEGDFATDNSSGHNTKYKIKSLWLTTLIC